jgi:hypothetical protein
MAYILDHHIGIHVPAGTKYQIYIHDWRIMPRIMPPFREYLPIEMVEIDMPVENMRSYLNLQEESITWMYKEDSFQCSSDPKYSLR